MRNSLAGLLFLMTFNVTSMPAQVGLEQYCYVNEGKKMTLVPILNYRARNNTYVEARYNYEELNTFSFYLGRTFSAKDELIYSATPMLGGVIGKFQGVSAGVNASVEYKKLFFATQSQYTRSFHESNADFLFGWSDVGYQPWQWFYVGLSAQQTYWPKSRYLLIEPGITLGFTIERWTFPLYCFGPIDNHQYFVLGVNYGVGPSKRNK